MNTVTQKMKFRQSLIKYAEKYGVYDIRRGDLNWLNNETRKVLVFTVKKVIAKNISELKRETFLKISIKIPSISTHAPCAGCDFFTHTAIKKSSIEADISEGKNGEMKTSPRIQTSGFVGPVCHAIASVFNGNRCKYEKNYNGNSRLMAWDFLFVLGFEPNFKFI